MKKNRTIRIATISIILIVFIITMGIINTGCNKTEELESTEIREYKGENLSSVNDLRENAIKGTQDIAIADYKLEIAGLVANNTSYNYDEIINDFNHYKKVVLLNCVEGWSANILWEGVLVKDIIKEADPLPEANTIIFYASDGYTTSFPIEYILDNDILMAYKMNEMTIPPENGFPFQLVAESKWGYKWIKWITKIELSDNASYEGFWESRGYSNDGDLDKEFFD